MDKTPALRVFDIPELVFRICHHLGPRHFKNAVLVCKVFDEALLPYRWRVLDTTASGHDPFPVQPNPEVAAALLKHGARFAREITLRESSVRLYYLLLRDQAGCHQLQTISHQKLSAGSLNDSYGLHRCWKGYDKVQDGLHEASHTYLGYCAERFLTNLLKYDSRLMVALLVQRNRESLRQLKLRDVVGGRNDPASHAFSFGMLDLLPTLRNLRVLNIGAMPLYFMIEVFAYLPEQVQDLSMEVCWEYERRNAAYGDISEQDSEYGSPWEDGSNSEDNSNSWNGELDGWRTPRRQKYHPCGCDYDLHAAWARAFRIAFKFDDELKSSKTSRLYRQREETDDGRPFFHLVDLMASTSNKIRLQRLCLSGWFPPGLPWVLLEMLRHSPNLTSLCLPTLADIRKDDWDSLLNHLSQLHDLHHLDMSQMELYSITAYNQLLLHLAPAGQHHTLIGRQQSNAADLRSLKIPEEVKFSPSFQTALALYVPLLEGFICEAFEETITGNQVLNMLETCPRLRTMVASSRFSGRGTQVCWRSFAHGRAKKAIPFSEPRSLLTAWPCAETLTVLSISLKVDTTFISEEDALQSAERVFCRLGQLRVLEDLSVGCDHRRVGYRRSNGAFGIEVTLNWTLRHGLDHLYSLRRLRHVDIGRLWRHNITRDELEWMVDTWPSLESLTGLARFGDDKPKGLNARDLQWIKNQLTGLCN